MKSDIILLMHVFSIACFMIIIFCVMYKQYYLATIATMIMLVTYAEINKQYTNNEHFTETDLQNTIQMIQSGNIVVDNIKVLNNARISNYEFESNSMAYIGDDQSPVVANIGGVQFGGQSLTTNHPIKINGINITNSQTITYP